MFEVGKRYRVLWLDGEGLNYGVYEVVEVDGPRVLVSQPGKREIINTSSPNFFKAEVIDDPALELEARHAVEAMQFKARIQGITEEQENPEMGTDQAASEDQGRRMRSRPVGRKGSRPRYPA